MPGGVATAFENAGDGGFLPVGQMAYLKEFGTHGQQNAGADGQDQTGKVPDRAVDRGNLFRKCLRDVSPPEKE